MEDQRIIQLPERRESSGMELFDCVRARRSRRSFSSDSIALQDLSDILFHTSGHTGPKLHLRAAPSAGGIHAITTIVVASGVKSLPPGVYIYSGLEHTLELHMIGDARNSLAKACLDQRSVETAPVSVVFAVSEDKVALRYGDKALRFAGLDIGHCGQNVYLVCEALGLATCAVGAFKDDLVSKAIDLPTGQTPYYVFPIGRR
ncbi:MAG: SagB/ThcOx family dehydrogenase [Candidatus Brocadiia bacterium]